MTLSRRHRARSASARERRTTLHGLGLARRGGCSTTCSSRCGSIWVGSTARSARTLNAISETTAETMRETTLQRAEAEFCRWRDMPDMEMRHAVYVLQNPPAAPENLEVSARNLVDNLRALGVRIELANKNSLRISPARLVTGRDKETIKRLKTHIIAEITSRSDVWHLE